MKKVISNVVFRDGVGSCVFAVMFVGVMDDQFIYAKRASIISANPETDPTYVKIARKDTSDMTNAWESEWDGPFMDIDVPDELGLKDSRLELEPELTDEIREAIEEVFKEYMKQ